MSDELMRFLCLPWGDSNGFKRILKDLKGASQPSYDTFSKRIAAMHAIIPLMGWKGNGDGESTWEFEPYKPKVQKAKNVAPNATN